MILTIEQMFKLKEIGYDIVLEKVYVSDILRWFRNKGYKYSITPAVLSNKVSYEIYTHTEVIKVDSWEEAEYEIMSRLIEIEYDRICI